MADWALKSKWALKNLKMFNDSIAYKMQGQLANQKGYINQLRSPRATIYPVLGVPLLANLQHN